MPLHQPSERSLALTPSVTLAIVARTAVLRAEGKQVLSLSVGEPDFPTPEKIREAGKYAIDHGITKYTAERGTMELRTAIAQKLFRDQRLSYAPDKNILVSNGGKHVISNLLLATINPGDDVILPAPYFLAYPELIKLAGGTPVIVPTEAKHRYILQPEQLSSAITAKTKLIVLCTPSNPTSTVYTRDELAALVPILVKSKLWILADEVYEHLLFDGREQASPAHFPELFDQTLYVSSFSKTYAMTGWRLGYGCGDSEIIKAAACIQGNMTSSPSAIAQYAGIEAVSNDQRAREEMRKSFERRRDLMYSLISQWEHVETPKPEGAFYCFLKIDEVWNANGKEYPGSVAVAKQILEEQHIAIVPGQPFGDDRCIRFSFAASDETIIEACSRIHQYLLSVKGVG
ncbi:MAG: pyridoxal phosphate-dependent aminotransferase [bacterium]|nr:pyridoxal phosphate-dependent aminotransferase [bacterium]